MELKQGAKGDRVIALQKRLNEFGFSSGKLDGVFGKKTSEAVIDFQRQSKLTEDGVVGPITSAALGFDHIFHVPEDERWNYKNLLLANPNYFGNVQNSSFEPVKVIASNTSYEVLSCIGLNPTGSWLEATVQINRPYGYGGYLCGDGSNEFVRFYIDYGSGWEDLGVASFNAHDLPNLSDCAGKPDKPLCYVVTLDIDQKREQCNKPVLPKVRAILSWNSEPPASDPTWIPVWGNVLDRHVQIAPLPELALIPGLLDHLKLPVDEKVWEVFPPMPFPPGPDPLPIQMLVEKYMSKSKAAVEPSRFGLKDLHPLLAGPFNLEAMQTKAAEWKKLKLDLNKTLVELASTSGNVEYEELHCLGLDYNREWLEAGFMVKKPSGFSGDLCENGSIEYIAFWADWDDTCNWSYLGTAEVKVHDIASIPTDGLHYAAVLPVDLNQIRRDCSHPKIGRIRAVLSWSSPPSTTDPNQLPYWGNRLDTHVQIKPGDVYHPQAMISIIGGIGVADINTSTSGLTKGPALFAMNGLPADAYSRECPFGGRVVLNAPPNPGDKYCIEVREYGSLAVTRVVSKVYVTNMYGISSWHAPDADGYFDYLPMNDNILNKVAHWDTTGDKMWEVRLKRFDAAKNFLDETPWYRVQLDNSGPDASIEIGGGACKTYSVGTGFAGTFVARDPYFGTYSLYVTGGSGSGHMPTIVPPTTGTTQTPVGGDAWSIQTNNADPCGYAVNVLVRDRAIINSTSNHHWSHDSKGFCIIA